ncbi:MAG: DUF3795 domain-containing protein [Acidobacteriia bacterium]|nr:DUF3795 domain-containing protein [Terriglobia bacterium]
MAELIAYCGLVCDTCPIYLATRQEDREEQARMRAEIARFCNEKYGTGYAPADINDCDGCRTAGGRLFFGCRECCIRQCAMPKGLENCAHCADYACEELGKFFAAEPSAKARLDNLRVGIHQNAADSSELG